jgi:hypothetical protein
MLMSAMVSILRDSSGSSPQWDSDGGIADGQPFQNSVVSRTSVVVNGVNLETT